MATIDRKQRRRQRLTILAVSFLALIAAVIGLWFFQQARHQSHLEDLRAQGLSAHEQGDHAAALESLESYLKENGQDPDALFAAADAVFRNPQPGNLHLTKARRWLMRARQIDPQHQPSRDLLLQLAARGFSPTDAITAANDVLSTTPDHPEALILRARKQAVLERYEQSNDDFLAYLQHRPDDYDAQLVSLQVRRELHQPVEDLLADAQALADAHPDDPRFELVLGMTHAMAGHADEARTLFETAAQRPAPQEEFIPALARAFDHIGRFDLATQYLRRVTEGRPLEGLLALKVTRRLFEAGEFPVILERLADLTPDQPAELFAIRAMAQFETGQREQAQATLEQLEQHPDRFGKLWQQALAAFYARPRVVADAINAGEHAVAQGLMHHYVQMMLGVLHAGVGDHHASLKYQQRASTFSPSWAAPLILAGKDYLALNQWLLAEQVATRASVRRPDLIEAHIIRALAMGKNTDALRNGQLGETLDYIGRILKRAPREERMLLLKIELLARYRRADDAKSIAHAMLKLKPPATSDGLIRLAALSRQFDLRVDDDAMRVVNTAYGTTPEIAYAQAIRAAEAGTPDAGLALIESAAKPADPTWQLVRAAYLDYLHDPRADDAYRRIADDFPQRLDVQRQVLASTVGRRDRPLADRIIDRLKNLAGEHSTEWRLERARWHLAAEQPDTAKAEALLDQAINGNPGDAQAYLLRARARELQGRLASAVQDAQAAERVRPDSAEIVMELARYQQANGNYAAAAAVLQRLADNPDLDPLATRRTASMLATQGEYAGATRLLEALQDRSDFTGQDRLLLARLYAQANRNPDADAQVQRLLQKPTPDAIAFAADFYGQLGQHDRAQSALDHLAQISLPTAQAQAIRAKYTGRYGSTADATALYTAAAQADPTNAAGWVRLAAYHVFQGQAEDALATARRGLHEAKSDPGLEVFLLRSSEISALIGDPAFRPIAGALLTSTPHRAVAETATRFLADARRANEDGPAIARGLQRLADAHPEFLALQTAAAEVHLRLGQPDPAIDIAQRAVHNFPGSVEAAQLLSVALADQSQWDRLYDAAQQWRKRAARNPFPADVMIAQAQLRMGQADNTLKTLDPYRAVVAASPDGRGGFAALFAEALIRTGRADDARRFLQPHLRDHDDWRLAWMRLATHNLDNPDARQQWLETVTPLVPADGFEERFALAQAWWTLHWQAPDRGADKPALELIDQAVKLPDASAQAHFLRGVMHETTGGTAGTGGINTAADAYRRALEIAPDFSVVRNNLSMLLIDADPTSEEALQLARQAVADQPHNANFRDTLAYVQAKAGLLEDAIANLKIAIDLEPQNPQWKQRLAELLKQSGSGAAPNELTAVPTP